MKRLFLTVCAVALTALATLPAFGQASYSSQYGWAALNLTGIGTTAASTTTTVTNQVIDCRGFQNVTFMSRINFSGATTSNVVYSFSRSVDGTYYETTPSVTWTMTPAATDSTNNCVMTKDVATAGCGYMKLVSIQNTHGSLVLTNLNFRYSVKRGAP